MLSTLRIATRQAAARRAPSSLFTFQAVRAASTWANVPQGPPVSLSTPQLIVSVFVIVYADHRTKQDVSLEQT